MGIISKGLIAAGALAGGIPLAKTAYDTYQDKLHYDSLKRNLGDQLPTILLAGLGGAVAGGGAGYATGKLRNGTYSMNSDSASKTEAAGKVLRALTGRTGMPDNESYADEGVSLLMRAKNRLPEAAQPGDAFVGQFDVNAAKAERDGAGQSFKYASYNAVDLILDKIAVSAGAALLTAAGLAGGGYALNKFAFRPWEESNRKKLNIADTVSQFAVPAAAVAGALVGGGSGYLAGKRSGEKQKDELAKDLYKATAGAHFNADLKRRLGAYDRVGGELVQNYLNGDN